MAERRSVAADTRVRFPLTKAFPKIKLLQNIEVFGCEIYQSLLN